MIISCHQPNFLPWSRFFEKVEQADLFVLLENVQFARHQFQNRFLYNGKWMTMPVENGNLTDYIKSKRYVDPENSWRKIKGRINAPILDIFDSLISESLSETNISIIELIALKLRIKTQIVRDTHHRDLDRSEKLLSICIQHGATEYLSGSSGKKYLNEQIFLDNGIKVSYFQGKNQSSIIGKIRD
jgi:hypothetical protein